MADKTPTTPRIEVKTNSITPTFDGLKIELAAILIADTLANGQNRRVRFIGSNGRVLKTGNTDQRCRCRYTHTIPLNKVKRILDNGGKINITVETETIDKKGDEKIVFADHPVEIFLPAGGFTEALCTTIIRKWKYFAEWIKATLALTVVLAFLGHTGQTNNFFGFVTALVFGLWLARKKKTVNYVISIIFVLVVFLLCVFYPNVFTDPVRNGALLAYICGMILYGVEEFFRRPNGKPYINCYPWFTLYIGGVVICFLVLDVFAGFLPTNIKAAGPLADPISLNREWNVLNYLPFCGNIDFSQIGWHIKWILNIGFAMLIQFVFGVPNEVIDWFKGRRERTTAAATGGSAVTFVYLLKEFWQTIKEFFRSFGRKIL